MTFLTWIGLAAALPFALVAAELAARAWLRWRRRYYVFPPGMRLRFTLNPALFPRLERTIRFDVNSDGERGEEVPRGPGRLYRVLVVGGSQPEGYLLDQATSWPGALSCLLQRPEHLARLGAARAHVGNIGRSGVGSEALALILRRVLPRYGRLDALVVLVGASDVLRWCEQGAPLHGPLPAPTSDVFRCHPEVAHGWTPGTMALGELARNLRRRWLRPVDVQEHAASWIGRARRMRARAAVMHTTMPDPSGMLERFDRHFRDALETAKRHADRVIVVRQTWWDRPCTREEDADMWHGAVGRAWQEKVTEFFALEVLSRAMALLDQHAASIADAAGVEVLHLRPLIETNLDNYYDWCHMTPAGSAIVASAVAAAIVEPSASQGRILLAS